jgi:hypothetical protein
MPVRLIPGYIAKDCTPLFCALPLYDKPIIAYIVFIDRTTNGHMS